MMRVTAVRGRVIVGSLGDRAPADLTPDEARRIATELLEAAALAERELRTD